jgi:heptosyltransferase I
VVLTGGPADAAATRDFHATLGEDGALVIVGAGRYPLGILPDLLRRSALVVSVNTGIMHMAAALNVPTISLNGPTAEHRWGPVGDCAVSVNSRLPGSGFLNLGWEYEGQREDAMLGIAVSDVLDSIQRSIGPARSGAPRARRTLSAAS